MHQSLNSSQNIRCWRSAEWTRCDIRGEGAEKNDGKLQHHGWEQWRKHGELLTPASSLLAVCLHWESKIITEVLFWFSFQVLGLKLPNVFGRAEKLTFQFSYGTKETSYGLSFFKPQPGNFDRKYVSWPGGEDFYLKITFWFF